MTARILERITPALDILFLCEPSNPAGQTTDRALLEKILERCDACGVLLVVDECFEEFLLDRSHSMVSNLTGHHLLILRAFTKFYGLAGVRLGYCLCQEETLLEQMRLAGAALAGVPPGPGGGDGGPGGDGVWRPAAGVDPAATGGTSVGADPAGL